MKKFFIKESFKEGYAVKRYGFFLFKIKKNEYYTKFYILGVQILYKFNKAALISKITHQFDSIKQYVSNEVFVAPYINKIQYNTFSKFRNYHQNKDIVIIATGPTLKEYTPIPEAIHIGVNTAYRRKDINFDYLFSYDYYSNKDYLSEILEYPAKIFLGSYYLFDQDINFRHSIPEKYYNNNVYRYCASPIRENWYPDISHFGMMDFGSVVFHALQFALFTNPRRIYLVGCDCTENLYFDGRQKFINIDAPPLKKILEGWKIIKKFQEAYYPDVTVISINPLGLKGLFKDEYTKK